MGMTREEAIKRLYEMQFYSACKADESESMATFWNGSVFAIDMAISALREQPRWISVEEALPPDQSDVLVVVLWNGEWQTMTGWLSCVTHEWRCVTPYGEHKPEKVTYWMPLPPPEVET